MTRSLMRYQNVGLFFLVCFGLGCPSKTQVVKKKKDDAQVIQSSSGCIRGKIVNEESQGFAGVQISSNPNTSLEVTNSLGFFKICYARKIINADTGETQETTIKHGKYSLVVVKEGFHSRPVTFDYLGKNILLKPIVLVEKTKPLPEVSKTKVKEVKRSSGSGRTPFDE